MIDLIRLALSGLLVYGIYTETGIYTAGTTALAFALFEFVAYDMKELNRKMEYLLQLQRGEK